MILPANIQKEFELMKYFSENLRKQLLTVCLASNPSDLPCLRRSPLFKGILRI